MKAYLLLFLLGIAMSFNCYKNYISMMEKGTYNKILFWSTCTCLLGMTGLKDDVIEECRCYLKDDLNACAKDSRCRSDEFFGCLDKKK